MNAEIHKHAVYQALKNSPDLYQNPTNTQLVVPFHVYNIIIIVISAFLISSYILGNALLIIEQFFKECVH